MDLPMFPLGSVLFPGQLLPLHIFEPRYQDMLQHCLRSPTKEFGVVLIERGHEVGGGDIRSAVGTVATILDAAEASPGHWAIVAAGTRRLRVQRWHPDDPWPTAEVEDLPDADTEPHDIDGLWQTLQERLTRVGELAAELGDDSYTSLPKVSDDPALGSYQLAALSPLGSFDRQQVLAAGGVGSRLSLLGRLMADVAETLEAEKALERSADQDDDDF